MNKSDRTNPTKDEDGIDRRGFRGGEPLAIIDTPLAG